MQTPSTASPDTEGPLAPGPPVIRSGQLEIDRERYLVTFAGEAVRLTYMEFHVLLLIAGGAGRIVSYEELALAFWGAPSALTRRRLAVLVSRIRTKLGAGARCIETVQRVGYRLTPAGA